MGISLGKEEPLGCGLDEDDGEDDEGLRAAVADEELRAVDAVAEDEDAGLRWLLAEDEEDEGLRAGAFADDDGLRGTEAEEDDEEVGLRMPEEGLERALFPVVVWRIGGRALAGTRALAPGALGAAGGSKFMLAMRACCSWLSSLSRPKLSSSRNRSTGGGLGLLWRRPVNESSRWRWVAMASKALWWPCRALRYSGAMLKGLSSSKS